MFLQDLQSVVWWYVMLLALGSLSWPTVRLIFAGFEDKGWAVSKIFGIGVVSLFMWYLGFFRLLPLSQPGVGIVVVIWGLFNALMFFKKQGGVQDLREINRRLILGEEVMFALLLLGWAFVRAHQPNIEGLEKYMDFGFVNSVLRSQYVPVKDMWLTDYTINYYYFGHYVAAVLTALSGIVSNITYNLMLATIVALSFSGGFSFGFNTVKLGLTKIVANQAKLAKWAVMAGLMSAVLLNFGGNLHTVTHKLREGDKPYWYPDATRFIDYREGSGDKTIHEFPIYSHVVADLHGHLNDLPFVILFLNLLVVMAAAKKWWLKKQNLPYLLMVGVMLGMMSMINFWDLPIYLMIFGGSLLLYSWEKWQLGWNALIGVIKPVALVIPVITLVVLPFQLNFINFSKGLGWVHARSPLWMLLILWGFFVLLLLGFLGLVVYSWYRPPQNQKQVKTRGWSRVKTSLVITLAKLLNVEMSPKNAKASKKKSIRVSAGNHAQPLDLLILAMLLTSLFLIIFPEVAYVKDIYIASHHRANTMFKLTYQTFVMTMLVSGYVFYRVMYTPAVIRSRVRLNRLWRVLFVLCVASVMLYPYFAVKSYYGNLRDNYKGLDGTAYLKNARSGDWAAINWFNTNVPGQPVVLEAVGDSYTQYARISANTGLPTVLGWPVHEWLWRGSYDIPGQRVEEVKRFYESTDTTERQAFLRKYKVKYIVVGQLEKEKYDDFNGKGLLALGEKVFSNKGTTVYQVR